MIGFKFDEAISLPISPTTLFKSDWAKFSSHLLSSLCLPQDYILIFNEYLDYYGIKRSIKKIGKVVEEFIDLYL